MPRTEKQFDPSEQFDSLMTEIGSELTELTTKISRLAFLREKIAAEHAAYMAAVDALEFYTEDEAAALLKTEPRMLADLRRKLHLPYCRIGREVRYTRDQLREIVAMLEMNGKRRKALQGSPLKLAA